jgi:hypothetical protein
MVPRMLRRLLMVLAFIPAFAAGWTRTSVPTASVAGGEPGADTAAAPQRPEAPATSLSR